MQLIEAEQSGWEARCPTQGEAVCTAEAALKWAPNHISCLFKGAAFRGKQNAELLSVSSSLCHLPPLPSLGLYGNTNLQGYGFYIPQSQGTGPGFSQSQGFCSSVATLLLFPHGYIKAYQMF